MKDSHTHLQKYPPDLLPEVLRRARAVGVTEFGCCATAPDDWARVAQIARTETGVEAAFGIHPWFARKVANTETAYETLRSLLHEFPSASIGEIGLDACRPEPKSQSEIFIAQLRIARESRRGVVLHCVRAAAEMTSLLRRHAPDLPFALLHSPRISEKEWRDFERLGVSVSIGPDILRPDSPKLRELVRLIPENRLLYETDSPENRNAPEYLPRVIAEVKMCRIPSRQAP